MRAVAVATIIVTLALVPAVAAPLDKAALTTILKDAHAAWAVPGIAVAVVDGDNVLLDAVGLRDLSGTEEMTPDTICGIGSITKSMLATTLAMLVQEGKADWDDHVRKHLPWFRLADPLADRDVTLRDLLAHRTGIARHDVLWHLAPWTVEESVKRLAFLEPEAPFRASYRYNNLAYMAAGLALEGPTGATWYDAMRARLHKPLGMTRTLFLRKDVLATADHALPHLFAGNAWQPAQWYDDDRQTRASGSVKSCARDLAKYLQFHLRGGLVDGKPLLGRKILDELYRPANVVPVPPLRAQHTGTVQASYALGWHVSDYRGEHLLEHGGAVDGFRTAVYLLPRRKFGVAVLTNCTEAGAAQAVGLTVLDRVLGKQVTDWHKALPRTAGAEETTRTARAAAREKARQPDTKPSRPLALYAGKYRDKGYGPVEVELKDGRLWLTWSSFREPLTHYHFDTFALPEPSLLAADLVAFQIGATGQVTGLKMLGREFVR